MEKDKSLLTDDDKIYFDNQLIKIEKIKIERIVSQLINELERGTNPLLIIDEFTKVQPFFYDRNRMWWVWDQEEYRYTLTDQLDIINALNSSTKNRFSVNSRLKNEIFESMKQIGRQKIPMEAPKSWIQFKDKIFDLTTGQMLPASPAYFICNSIPLSLGESEETPVIDKIFTEWVGERYKQTLYEIIAYCCYTDYPIHIMFALIGHGRNGKSKFQELLRKFIGVNNTCSSELDALCYGRFETFKLYKKLVCSLGETNFAVLTKTSMLKKLTGQDLIGYEKKNCDPYDSVNYAKIIINSNSLPSSEDQSEGFFRRFLIIDFPHEFPEGHDILAMIPPIEYRNLAKKCLIILPELLARGSFTNQGSIQERKENYMKASNPLSFFIKQQCTLDYNSFVRYSDLYNAYCLYLIQFKRRKVSRKEFNNALENEGLFYRKCNKKIDQEFENGYFIEGLKLNDFNNCDNCDNYDRNLHPNAYRGFEYEYVSQLSQLSQNNKDIIENNSNKAYFPEFSLDDIVHHNCIVINCNRKQCNLNDSRHPICETHWSYDHYFL